MFIGTDIGRLHGVLGFRIIVQDGHTDPVQPLDEQTLVARGDYRLNPGAPDGTQVFQLHPGAWHFAAGHVPELELLGRDSPYLRASNGTFSITVTGLRLRLPVS